MAIEVGQKVVCIEDKYRDPNWGCVGILPQKGATYTVRAIYMHKWPNDGPPSPCLLLSEIKNPVYDWKVGGIFEHGFPIERFRPVVDPRVELPTEITALLDPANYKIREPVRQRTVDPSPV